MTDWTALARARGLDIPAEAVAGIEPSLHALEESFRGLLANLPFALEPAVILSEPAVFGE
jgi:xanthine/uracil/vitamin C permease (AzgA family)